MGDVQTIKIEWGVDLDDITVRRSIGGGPERKFKLKARCKACWGGLLARSDESHAWTGIKCRVCGKTLEGDDAAAELDRMHLEELQNWINLDFGSSPEYGDGVFLWKLFPDLERLEQTELESRVKARRKARRPPKRLTRHSFPLGAPGLLFMQAQILVSGLASLAVHAPRSVVEFPDVDIEKEGAAVAHLSVEGLRDDPKYHENSMKSALGVFSMQSLTSAFACELAMKAISLTCNDEAFADHDLVALYEDLPSPSRGRLEADCPEIRDVLEDGRHVFGLWRYVEKRSGPESLRHMIDLGRTKRMEKIARVLLDEGDVVGLAGTVDVHSKREFRVEGEDTLSRDHTNLAIRGREGPPKL